MPQGQATRVPTPSGILLFDPLATDDGGLLPSSFNVIQRYGTLESRPGFQSMGGLTAGDIALGAFYIRDKVGSVQFFVGSDRRHYRYNNASRVFDVLTGPALTGSVNCPTTFTYFEQGDFQYALSVNGIDAAMEHQVGTTAYGLITAGYIARSICTVANRVFYGNTTIGGIRFPTMVAWSAAGDRSTNPALARQKLIDEGGHIIAVRRGRRKSVYIYREDSIWTGNAKVASDANAFDFDVAAQSPGPVGPAAIASDPAFRQMFLASDLNLRVFDGTNCDILAPTSDYLSGRFNPIYAALTQVVYDPIAQELKVSLPLDGDTIPTHALTYSFITGGVFPTPWNRIYPVTLLASLQVELETPTCMLPNVPTCELPDVPTCQLGFTPGQQTVVIGSNAIVGTHAGSDDLGEAIETEMDVLMPLQPGGEYEFSGVEIQATTSSPLIAVSVLLGLTFDRCTTEIPLGTIDPSLAIPAYGAGPPDDVAGGPNMCRLMSDDVMRGRCVIVRLRSVSPTQLQIRRVELVSYGRMALA